MAKDAELDRLKTAQDLAYQRKQDAYQAQQRAYQEQDSTLRDLQRMRDSYGPIIERLNSLQETAFQNMKRAFDNASSAYDRRDGAGAASYAAEGHRYEAESQGYVNVRRGLVAELRSAKERHDATKPAFQRAKDDFNSAKRAFDSANAAKAGVPHQYHDNVWISTDSSGNTNIYFGGFGKPNGPGHGHYVMDRSGKVTYMRDPFDPHGAQNFTQNQRDYTDVIGREVASGGEFGFRCKFRGYDAYVESNTNRQGRAKIDIYYGPNGPFGPGHHHAVAYRESPYDFVADNLR